MVTNFDVLKSPERHEKGERLTLSLKDLHQNLIFIYCEPDRIAMIGSIFIALRAGI
jgi:hypothetical protein